MNNTPYFPVAPGIHEATKGVKSRDSGGQTLGLGRDLVHGESSWTRFTGGEKKKTLMARTSREPMGDVPSGKTNVHRDGAAKNKGGHNVMPGRLYGLMRLGTTLA